MFCSLVFMFIVMVFPFSNSAMGQEVLPATTEDIEAFDENVPDFVTFQGDRADQSLGAEDFGLEVSEAAQELKDADVDTRTEFGDDVRANENFPGRNGGLPANLGTQGGIDQARGLIPSQGELGRGNPLGGRP